MTFRLVDSGWHSELTDGLRANVGTLRIVCPFIKAGALERLLKLKPKAVEVITRYNLADFADGVSDIAALRRLLAIGARVRGIRNLHAKLYLFGTTQAVITSANLTSAALDRNSEFGIVTRDAQLLNTCQAYFDRLWARGDKDLLPRQLDEWDDVVTQHRATGGRPRNGSGLSDYGAVGSEGSNFDAATATHTISLPIAVADAPQAYVKFLGEGHNRVPLSFSTLEEIKRAGCHWALAYPSTKRPTGVQDGALMFIGRMTRDPNDIRIFGRAIGLKHRPGRDDATPQDIALRTWKNNWPRYVRVFDAEFIAGAMHNGVSLNELMDALGADSFAPTQRNARRGKGNLDPRRAYLQQAAVKLSPEGSKWLSQRLQEAFDEHGSVARDELTRLDWPTVP